MGCKSLLKEGAEIKLYTLECDGGFVRESPAGYQCVSIEKATVVNKCYRKDIELLANSAKEAGLRNLRLIELTVSEGESIMKL